jgi:hypothetical protein
MRNKYKLNKTLKKFNNIKGGVLNNVTKVENVPYNYNIVVEHDRYGNEIISNVIGRYSGLWRNNKPFRNGRFVLQNNGFYEGPWEDGVPNGYYGEYTFPSGNKYIGQFKDGHMNGHGTFLFNNGNKYIGQFNNGDFNGEGTMNYVNGDIYNGQFLNGSIHGSGILTFANGNKYIGNFENNERSGYGVLEYVSGNKYEGQWRNNLRDGVGTFTKSNQILTGRWRNNTFEYGDVSFLKTGVILRGNFRIVTDQMGRILYFTTGTAHYPDGSRFQGTFINFKKHDGNAFPIEEKNLANYDNYDIINGFNFRSNTIDQDPSSISYSEFL